VPRPRGVMSEEDRQLLIRWQANLTALTKHPSWPELEAEVARKEARLEKMVLAKVLGGNGIYDQREIDYMRGFVNGMKWFAAVPSNAEHSLERFLEGQGVKTEGAT
jgi:hypothetical protein